MTDNEIKKALESCMNGRCDDECPFRETREHCHNLDSLILGLINRLQAENESLKNAYKQCTWERDVFQTENERLSKITRPLIAEIKTEAMTEFAEELEGMASQGFWETDAYVGIEQIKDLLKEKIGNDMGIYDPYTDSFVKEEMVGDSND